MKRSFLLLFIGVVLFFSINVQAEYIWSMVKPVAVEPFSFLDHTYACIGNSNTCFTCPAGASKTGGDPVIGGYGDVDQATCYAYCPLLYGVNGVCHQHTNRVLNAIGETLISECVSGYSYSVALWGIWGNNFIICLLTTCE